MMRLAVFASGRGSNLAGILEACREGLLEAEVGLIVCNQPGAGAVAFARDQGIPLHLADTREDRYPVERKIADELARHRIELVVLAGWMKLLSPFLIGFLYDPRVGQSLILNIHPADTASYQGPDGYGWAIATGRRETSITVHFVDEGMDTGEVILKQSLPIHPGESIEQLRERGLAVEHQVYPLGIREAMERIKEMKRCAAF
jgi:phosphoribosylglycinamide formyltransferase-1